MEPQALLDALGHKLAEMEPEKFGDTVAYVEGIAFTIGQLKADTLIDTLGHV